MKANAKFSVYQDKGQWIPYLNWFWIRPNETGMGHGPYPARAFAWLAGWWATR